MRKRTTKGPWLWLVTLIGAIVPRRLRADWQQEWEAELRYRERSLAQWDHLNWRTKLNLFSHSAGAFMDALWLQPRRWEDAMIQDLRFGVRMLVKNKGFTAVAIFSLALGIGANTAIFQLVNAVRLRMLPVRAPEELVEVRRATILIRSHLKQIETTAAIKRVLNEINPSITVSFLPLKPMIDATIMRERLIATLAGFFGALALLLASIGLYGILSYGVASRTTELGIRIALGAHRKDVFWLIQREALWLVLIGVMVGLPLILAMARVASALLFGLSPTDPVSLIAAAVLMLVIAIIAGYLPSRRATRVDPIVALRYE